MSKNLPTLTPATPLTRAQERAMCVLVAGGRKIHKQAAQALIRKGWAIEADNYHKLAFAPGVEEKFLDWCQANR